MLIAEGSHWEMVAMKSTENMIDIICTYIAVENNITWLGRPVVYRTCPTDQDLAVTGMPIISW